MNHFKFNRVKILFITILFSLLTMQSSQAQIFNYELIPVDGVGLGGKVIDINNKGEFIYEFRGGSSILYLPDSAYGLPAGANILLALDGTNDIFLRAINDNGIIVGQSRGADTLTHLTVWTNGVPNSLIPDDTTYSWAWDINNLGHISGGKKTDNSGLAIANGRNNFIYDGLQFNLVITPRGFGYDTCVTNTGSIFNTNNNNEGIGLWMCGDDSWIGPHHYYLWEESGERRFGYDHFIPHDINDSGQVLGYIYFDTTYLIDTPDEFDTSIFEVYIFENDTLVPAPNYKDSTFHINESNFSMKLNNLGQVVGESQINGFSNFAFLWLTKPAYGLTEGMYNLNDLVDLPTDQLLGPPALNNRGQIVLKGRNHISGVENLYLLSLKSPPGIIVNSIGDEPDSSIGDGVCATAGGDCTLRAAIMEANAQVGIDSIMFDITTIGVPVIQPLTELPHLSEIVYINGTTQPISGYVEIDGTNIISGSGVSGLTFKDNFNEITGLLINNFSGSGITLNQSNDNLIYNNFIGTDLSGLENRGNLFHGIHIINSNDNVIGGLDPNFDNRIAFNLNSGIYVESGIGNSFRNNKIYKNGLLGIDIAPSGVNFNDTLDIDVGANNKVNYPVIDSVVSDNVISKVYGKITAVANVNYAIEVYYSDTCDLSGFGEGQIPVASLEVNTDINGVAVFTAISTQILSFSQFVTAIATDELNNSSEFSACWPQKKLKLVDANGDSLANKEFILSKIAYDIPDFSDTSIVTFRTDLNGMIDLSKYYRGFNGDTLKIGDSIKIHQVIHTEYSEKHPTLVPSAYTVELDNAKFDTLGKMSYPSLDSNPEQTIKLDHTTLNYSMVVSIEWDADIAFIQSVEEGFRGMANYMYDVTDGQLRFDTIMIYDDKNNWDFADIHINTSNMIWPHVQKIGGVLNPVGSNSYPIEMPRQWFGSEDKTRNLTYSSFPPDLSASKSYRTFAHEFGHYALSLKDEYQFFVGSRCSSHPIPANPYGYMDFMYESGGVMASELSTSSAYLVDTEDTTCQNNDHWGKYGQSTWQTVDALFQKTYNGILSPILRPIERTLPVGFNYLLGPNDNLADLDYDVGKKVIFPVLHTAPNALSLNLLLTTENASQGDFLPNLDVITLNPDDVIPKTLKQGKTADNGKIRVIGFKSGDKIFASGTFYVNLLAKSAVSEPHWLYGTSGAAQSGVSFLKNNYTFSASNDSLEIVLKEVAGNKALITDASLEQIGMTLRLDAPNIFATPPTVDHKTNNNTTSFTFNSDADGYAVSITDTLKSNGKFQVWAIDDSAATYFFDINYVSKKLDSNLVNKVIASDANAEVSLDNSGTPFDKALLMSTQYPVLRTGLHTESVQGGAMQTLSLFPNNNLLGDNGIIIRYSDADINKGQGFFGNESSLKIHQWNDLLNSWEYVGGIVDTLFNEVFAEITTSGVFAAFTTDIATDIDDGIGNIQNLPHQFNLSQNYPNPFNPSTEINFSLPKRSHVKIEIFNILGRQVKILVDDKVSAGFHVITWDGRDNSGQSVSSGIYLYRFTTEDYSESKKMLLLK